MNCDAQVEAQDLVEILAAPVVCCVDEFLDGSGPDASSRAGESSCGRYDTRRQTLFSPTRHRSGFWTDRLPFAFYVLSVF